MMKKFAGSPADLEFRPAEDYAILCDASDPEHTHRYMISTAQSETTVSMLPLHIPFRMMIALFTNGITGRDLVSLAITLRLY